MSAEKILVFEFITGGGFNREVLPEDLLVEGQIMVQALLRDLQALPQLQIELMLDARCRELFCDEQITFHLIDNNINYEETFSECLALVEAVWIIAPEFEHILERLTSIAEQSRVMVLGSNTQAIKVAADKWQTFQKLNSAGIPTVTSLLLADMPAYIGGDWVIKPRDGVGCAGISRIDNAQAFANAVNAIVNVEQYLVQPFIDGETLSFSCLFSHGQGDIISVNQQVMAEQGRQFKLLACDVNAYGVEVSDQQLVAAIAEALPGLFGYVGIDLIADQNGQRWVLEINPRLTSSYAGISAALGINCAELVLALEDPFPTISRTQNKLIKVDLKRPH